MLIPLVIAFGEVPMEHIAEMLHDSGLFESKEETLKRLQEVEKQQQELVLGEWGKRRKQILSGTSKFATEVEPGIFYRNSACFTPFFQIPEDVLEEKELPAKEAEDLWVESFRCQLLKKKCDDLPLIYEKNDKKVKIYLLKNKKYSFFYGFR